MSEIYQLEVLRNLRIIALILFFSGFAGTSMAALPIPSANPQQSTHAQPVPMSRLSNRHRQQLEVMLTEEVQQLVNRQKRIEGQGRDVTAKVNFDVRRSKVVVNLSRSYLPSGNGAEWEDLTRAISNLIYDLLEEDLTYRELDILIGGKSIIEYYPDEVPIVNQKSARQPLQETPTVVVAAGHGVYFHYGFLDWRAQRDPSNGIIEDFLTPSYASQLTTWLHQRSQVMVRNDVRSSSLELHGRSQRPWVEMAARYHLRDEYPNNLEICCSLPNADDNLRERDEDIRSRPLYANHVGANTLIHLHSNASENATSRGARVYVQPDRAIDYALATSILCSMREVVQAQPAYATFPVAAAPHVENLGENRLANMPSIIVETGFHTNPTDAVALQDAVFRTAAMKGVEKGYRLHREGKACQTLRITSIPPSTGPHNTYIPINVHFEGNPQFPVRFDTVTITCPSGGWNCQNYSTTVTGPAPSPLTFSVRCTAPNTQPTATFGVRTIMVDADGVKSAPFDHSFTCARP